jgi:hypothetical protein
MRTRACARAQGMRSACAGRVRAPSGGSSALDLEGSTAAEVSSLGSDVRSGPVADHGPAMVRAKLVTQKSGRDLEWPAR